MTMIVTSVPRLDNLVAARIAIVLCTRRDVKISVRNLDENLSYILSFQANNRQWRELQANFSKKISTLGLPPLLQKKVNGLIRPILLEIEQWKDDHCEVLCTCVDLQAHFVWNTSGVINREKTVRALIKIQNFDIRNRFVLSCLYFLEDEIRLLWQKISQVSIYDADASPIVRYWVNWLRGDVVDWSFLTTECVLYPPPNLFPRNALVFSCFIHILPTAEKLSCLIFQINRRRISQSDLLTCLSKLDANERVEVYRACAKDILRHFVNWPLQKHFLEMADTLWPYLSDRNFVHLLEFIIRRRILQDWTDFDYMTLLEEFWVASPDDFKEFVAKTSIFKTLMLVLHHDRTKQFPKRKLRRRVFGCPVSIFNALRLACTRG